MCIGDEIGSLCSTVPKSKRNGTILSFYLWCLKDNGVRGSGSPLILNGVIDATPFVPFVRSHGLFTICLLSYVQ